MNIIRKDIDAVNAELLINIGKEDYEKPVADKLKDYRLKASVPGFRPGKVPATLIKKRFGTAILLEEINTILTKGLTDYLSDNKLSILGEPLPSEKESKTIDWDNDETFEFTFDIAIAPNVNVELNKDNHFDYYKIKVTDEMIDSQVDMISSQLGKNIPAETAAEKSLVRGNFEQLDEKGEIMPDGIKAEGVLLSVDLIKESSVKNSFLGSKKDEVITFDPVKAYEDRHEVGHLLNIKHEVAEELNSDFKFTVTEILDFEKAELNEELFIKIYGENTEVKTIDDFRAKLKEELQANLSYSSEHQFAIDTRKNLLALTAIELPEAFLKRWLLAVNKQATPEQVEADFGYFTDDLKWQLIKNNIIDANELDVTEEETHQFAMNLARAQFQQYGYYNVPDDQIDSFAHKILEKEEESERIYKKLFEDKVIGVVKEKAQVVEKEVTQEEFAQLGK